MNFFKRGGTCNPMLGKDLRSSVPFRRFFGPESLAPQGVFRRMKRVPFRRCAFFRFRLRLWLGSSKINEEVIFLKKMLILFCLFFCFGFSCLAVEDEVEEAGKQINMAQQETRDFRFETLKAKIVEASEPYELDDGMKGKYQDLKIYINDDDIRTTLNITASLTYYIDTTNYSKEYKPGDKVFVYTTFEDNKIVSAEIVYRDTTAAIVGLIVLFFVVVILVGGMKGVKSMISLVLTIVLIFMVLIPGIIAGKNPLMLTVIISVATIIITFLLIGGFKKKTLAAILGTAGGLITAGFLAVLFGNLFVLTGMCEETGMITVLSETARGFDLEVFCFQELLLVHLVLVWMLACRLHQHFQSFEKKIRISPKRE